MYLALIDGAQEWMNQRDWLAEMILGTDHWCCWRHNRWKTEPEGVIESYLSSNGS